LQILIEKAGKSVPPQILQFLKYLDAILNDYPLTLNYLHKCLKKLSTSSGEIVNTIDFNRDEQYKLWANNLSHQCNSALDELTSLAPWVLHPDFSELVDKYPKINAIPTLREILKADVRKLISTGYAHSDEKEQEGIEVDDELKSMFRDAANTAKGRIQRIELLARQSIEFATKDYDFLYDKSRHLLSIGYNVEERLIDSGYYDLLASEARLSSFVAIAQDKIPTGKLVCAWASSYIHQW
jgi:cyclic beta-1,2-glucan synthetase